MTEPEKCPFCGSPVLEDTISRDFRQYSCFTTEYAPGRFERESDCFERQVASLKAEVEKLKTALEKINIELSALVPDPRNPDFMLCLSNTNEADADCLMVAINEARNALTPESPCPTI